MTSDILVVTTKISFTPSTNKLLFSKPWNPNKIPIITIFINPEFADNLYSDFIKTLQFDLVY